MQMIPEGCGNRFAAAGSDGMGHVGLSVQHHRIARSTIDLAIIAQGEVLPSGKLT